jgi:DNA (cytosine-5)-methyltransferase 1
MRFLSLFSGIESASVAWLPLGWECVAVSEIDPFACAVLKHHFPDVPNLGDVCRIDEKVIRSLGQIDLVVFGFPCSDLSEAGRRKGLYHKGKPTRSGLFFEATRIIRLATKHNGCRWFVAENVEGLFSSSSGRDFAAVLSELNGLDVRVPNSGWQNTGVCADIRSNNFGVAWAVLNSEYWNVAQRRKRVFIVGHIGGEWRRAAAVLLDATCVRRDTRPRRKTGAIASAITRNGVGGGGGADDNSAQANHLIAMAFALRGREGGAVPEVHEGGDTIGALRAASGGSTRDFIAVTGCRRILPIEAERLMAFPDNFTLISYKGKLAADSLRFKALGNSIVTNVLHWIGKRIQMVEDIVRVQS